MTFRAAAPPLPVRPDRRRWTTWLVAAVALVLLVPALACESKKAEVDQVRNAVNSSRAAAGLPALRQNLQLDYKADRWAQTMRNRCSISHSNLRDGVPANWRALGENVGRGGSIDLIHRAYMNSPGHRAHVLSPRFTQIGTAAVWGTCAGQRTVFTVHVFMAT